MARIKELREKEKDVAVAAKKESFNAKKQADEAGREVQERGSSKGGASKSSKSSGSAPPSTFEAFEADDSVTLHLVVKNSAGEEVTDIQMGKTQFKTGSFGWTLTDKVQVDNGEGGTMSVSLNSNCECRRCAWVYACIQTA
jgi:hypothetical protein